jgi:C1A family cysteine protease
MNILGERYVKPIQLYVRVIIGLLIMMCMGTMVGAAFITDTGIMSQKQEYIVMGGVSGISQTYPIMQPTEEELKEWNTQYLAAPKAVPRGGNMVSTQDMSSSSLLDYVPYVAAERDQDECGNCWVWASTSAIEVAHATQNNIADRSLCTVSQFTV